MIKSLGRNDGRSFGAYGSTTHREGEPWQGTPFFRNAHSRSIKAGIDYFESATQSALEEPGDIEFDEIPSQPFEDEAEAGLEREK